MNSIYFDNAATSYPKPPSVKSAVLQAMECYGGNPGRSGHKISLKTAEMVFSVRERVAKTFGAQVENVVFTQNCTHALNLAIKGVSEYGDRIVISSLEHNSVLRPAYALSKQGTRVDIALSDGSDEEILEEFLSLINSSTRCVVCTAASNVTGRIMPISRLAEICKKRGVCFIVDAAQIAGILPVKVGNGINFICCAGHKGLYGTTGTGLLISDGSYSLNPIIQGGTGATSGEPWQTPFMPELLESGTLNTIGIASLGAGLSYIEQIGIDEIFEHETTLCESFISQISEVKNIEIYRKGESFVPLVSFNIKNLPSQEVANALSRQGFMLRGGLHCAVLAHKTIGTMPEGTVRFSPSVFSSSKHVEMLANTVKKFAKNLV